MSRLFNRGRIALGFTLLFVLALSSGVTVAAGTTTRVSVTSGGAEANGPSGLSSISASGDYVVFISMATNLVPGDNNGLADIFVRNLNTNTTEILNLGARSAQDYVEFDVPFPLSISSNGQYVAFMSMADDLVAGDANEAFDIFVNDGGTGANERISAGLNGADANGMSYDATISPDGRYVVFTSEASNLVANDTNDQADVFVHDRTMGTTERINEGSGGIEADGASDQGSISDDARYVSFTSEATNLVSETVFEGDNVYVHDRTTGDTVLASAHSNGTPGDDKSHTSMMSGNGRYVVFESDAHNFRDDIGYPFPGHVYRHDLTTGVTELVSWRFDDTHGAGGHWDPAVSADGRFVTFTANFGGLVPEDDNGDFDVFLRDITAGTTEWISVTHASDEEDEFFISYGQTISADGSLIAFASDAPDLVPDDISGNRDIFVYDRQGAVSTPGVNAGGDAIVILGDPFSQSGVFADPDSSTWTATVDYGDGDGPQPLTLNPDHTFQLNYVYQEDDEYTITVEICDGDGNCGSDTIEVEVLETTLRVFAGGTEAALAGEPFSFDDVGFTDPFELDSHTATIDWGDGSPVESAGVYQATNDVYATHTYTQIGEYDVLICVQDNVSLEACDSFMVLVTDPNNTAPSVDAGDDGAITEGAPFTRGGSFTDPDTSTAWTATVHYGDWQAEQPLSLNSDKTFNLNHTYLDDGAFTVTVEVCDNVNACGVDTFEIQVSNVAPTVNAGADQTASAGTLVSLPPASYTDPGADLHTATIDWGDGSPIESTAVEQSGNTVSGSHTYAAAGEFTVTVCVTDDNDGEGCDSFIVTVTAGQGNQPPTVDAGSDQAVDVGEVVNLAPATFTDPDAADTHTATINWGDGSPEEAGSVDQNAHTIGGSHTYGSADQYTVTVCVTDSASAEDCDSFLVTVTAGQVNQPPVVDLGDAVAIADEGSPLTRNGSFSDPDSGSWTATVDFGDGGGPVNLALTGMSYSLSHTYADNGSYTLEVCVTDDGSETGCDTIPVTINNVAPVVNAGADQTAEVGDTVSLQPATFSDAGLSDTHTATITWGDGSPAGSATVDQQAGTVLGSHSYTSTGVYTVEVCVTDDDGAEDCDSLLVEVTDQPVNGAPSVSAGDDASVDEGDAFSGAGTFSDADSSSWTATVNYGDGSGVVNLPLSGSTFSLSHAYADDGSYTVTVCVTDEGSETGCDDLTVTVNNVAPVISAGPNQTATAGGVVTLGPLTFNDPGSLDSHSATINWGDGSSIGSGIVNQAANTVSGSHTYASSGDFTVTICVMDNASAEQCDDLMISVLEFTGSEIELCASRHNGMIRIPNGDCARHEVVLSMPDDLPLTFCVNHYTGILRYLAQGRCSPSEWQLSFPNAGEIHLCVSNYTQLARYSPAASGCRTYERLYVIGEVTIRGFTR